jgi:hypothetical protein
MTKKIVQPYTTRNEDIAIVCALLALGLMLIIGVN